MPLKVEGLTEVTRDLGQIADAAGDFTQAFNAIEAQSVQIARSAAPTLTGRLRASIRGETTPNRASVTANTAYAGAINYGWRARNIRPAYYMQAVDRVMESRAAEIIVADLNRITQENGF